MTKKEFSENIVKHDSDLRSHALRLCSHNIEDAKDLLQETYIRAFRFLHQYRKDTNFFSWIYVILKNLYFNKTIHRYNKQVITDFSNPLEYAKVGSIDYRERGDLDDKLFSCYMKLKEFHKELIIDFHFEGLSREEIAEKHNITLSAVMGHLHRARTQLRDNYLGRVPKKRVYRKSA